MPFPNMPEGQQLPPDIQKQLLYQTLVQMGAGLLQRRPQGQSQLGHIAGNVAGGMQDLGGRMGNYQQMVEAAAKQKQDQEYRQAQMGHMGAQNDLIRAQIAGMGQPNQKDMAAEKRLQEDRERNETARMLFGAAQDPEAKAARALLPEYSPELHEKLIKQESPDNKKEPSDTQLYSILVNSNDPEERKRAANMLEFRRAQPAEVYGTTKARGEAEIQTAGPKAYQSGRGTAQAEIETGAEIERQKGTGRNEVEFSKNAPKMRNTLTALDQQWGNVEKEIDRAIAVVSPFTAGVGGLASVIPATPQKDLSTTLDMIRANIGFDKLQQIRADSPTGGALGQVSDFENKLLQAVKGSLDQKQSPSQLKRNLLTIKSDLQKLRDEKKKAFSMDYGKYLPEQAAPAPAQGGGSRFTIREIK